MKKKAASREKTGAVEEKDLAWVKGSSGYITPNGREEDPNDPPPPGDGG